MPLYRTKSEHRACERGRNAVDHYWGCTAGGQEDLDAAEIAVREAQFTPEELHDLRARLPIGATGPTGARIARVDRMLKRIEKESAH